MAARKAMPSLFQPSGPVLRPRCAVVMHACVLQACSQSRHVSTSYLDKVEDGERRWADRAEKIQNGEVQHTWDMLEQRGYIKDHAGSVDKIKEIMRIKRIGAYVGIDPTAESLHVGHLLPLMPLFWMWFHGYPATTLVGGGTARIGDPTGRLTTREAMSNSEISKNIFKIHIQLSKLWHNAATLRDKYGFEKDWAAKHRLLNNNMWLQGLTMYEFTKRIANHTRLGPMLSRETVKRKMTEGDGMSLGEFLYPMFQGWDFWHMYNKLGVQMQIGGSDQYGNIVAGIDILKAIRDSEEAPHAKMSGAWQHEPLGFTVPLVVDAAGNKLGKSAGNAVWCDEFKTSAFDFYGYFVSRSDDEVESLLKLFTFMPMDKIQATMADHRGDPAKRTAQHTLAFEVTSLVHGSQRALEEAQQHNFRFGGELPKILKEPSEDSGIITANTAPRIDLQLPRSILKLSPAKVMRAIGFVKSNTEGHTLVRQQGAYVAGQPGQMKGLVPGNLSWTPVKAWYPEETSKFLIDGNMLIFRKGKRNVRIVELVSDEEWKESGRIYPGESYTGVTRRLRQELQLEAEQKGERLTKGALKEAMAGRYQDDSLTVANNPDIELPSKQELRERAREKKRNSTR